MFFVGSFKQEFMCILTIISCCSFVHICADSIQLNNNSDKNLWVYIKKLGPGDVDWSGKDKQTVLKQGQSLTENGNISGIWVFPVLQDAKELKDEELRKKAESKSLYQLLGKTKWPRVMSFAIGGDGKEYLYFGKNNIDKPFSFLNTSDIHPIGPSEKYIKEMNMKGYEYTGGKDKILSDFKRRREFINTMSGKILRVSNNVQAVLLTGDVAGGTGYPPEVEAFKKTVYEPLQRAFSQAKQGGFVFTCMGNHDTYRNFDLVHEVLLDWLKKTYGDYIYAFNIGQVRFINLGLFPTTGSQRTALKDKGANSLGFLRTELSRLSKQQPVVVFFHYPIHGAFSDWWTKQEKNNFYRTIKDYNVIAILVGHAHTSRIWMFRDKCKVIQSAYPYFTQLDFDPNKPRDIEVELFNKDGKRMKATVLRGEKETDISKERLQNRREGKD